MARRKIACVALLYLALAACSSPAPRASITPSQFSVAPTQSPPITVIPSHTDILPTPTHTLKPTPTNTPTPRLTIAPTQSHTPTPTPSPIAPAVLVDAFRFDPIEGLADYPLQRTGDYALGLRSPNYCQFGPFRWLDGEHLLIMPVVGRNPPEDQPYEVTQPLVQNLAQSQGWLAGAPQLSCLIPKWSSSLRLLMQADGEGVQLWDLNGRLLNSLPGTQPLHLAPSGRRLLAGQTWLDLESGEAIQLASWSPGGQHPPAWSADERRLFACCFAYADLDTGQQWATHEFELPDFFIGGRGSWFGEESWSASYWLPGERQAVVDNFAIWFMEYDTNRFLTPLFNPTDQSHEDLNSLLNPAMPANCDASFAPGGTPILLICRDERGSLQSPAYLATFPNVQFMPVEGEYQALSWSADGDLVALNRFSADSATSGVAGILNLAGSFLPLATNIAHDVLWHPTEPALALRFEDATIVELYDGHTGRSRTLRLTSAITHLDWRPNDLGLAMATTDGQILYLPNAFDDSTSPIPLTPVLPAPHTLRWSPDGRRLAFVSGPQLYVVTVQP